MDECSEPKVKSLAKSLKILSCFTIQEPVLGVTELAARFHRFYNVCRIKDAEPAVRDARLKLADTTRRVLEIGLGIIGVTAPEKM